MTPYIWIFVGSYALVFAGVFWFMMVKQALTVRKLQASGVGDAEIDRFRSELFPKTVAVLLWATFFTGSIIGSLAAGIYWLLDL